MTNTVGVSLTAVFVVLFVCFTNNAIVPLARNKCDDSACYFNDPYEMSAYDRKFNIAINFHEY